MVGRPGRPLLLWALGAWVGRVVPRPALRQTSVTVDAHPSARLSRLCRVILQHKAWYLAGCIHPHPYPRPFCCSVGDKA